MSQFDPNSFLDITLTEPTEKRPPLPVGDYVAVIGEVKSRTWQGKKDPTKSGIAWDVPLAVEVPPLIREAMKISTDTLTLRDSIMLDLTAGGTIDNAPGANRRLRMYREACDLNKPGDTFSGRAMQGRPIKVRVSHEIYEGQPVERVEAVTRV